MIFVFHSFSESTNRNGGVVLVFEVAATPRVWKSALDPLLDSNILLQSYCGFTQFYTVSQKKLVKSHPSLKESSAWPDFTGTPCTWYFDYNGAFVVGFPFNHNIKWGSGPRKSLKKNTSWSLFKTINQKVALTGNNQRLVKLLPTMTMRLLLT